MTDHCDSRNRRRRCQQWFDDWKITKPHIEPDSGQVTQITQMLIDRIDNEPTKETRIKVCEDLFYFLEFCPRFMKKYDLFRETVRDKCLELIALENVACAHRLFAVLRQDERKDGQLLANAIAKFDTRTGDRNVPLAVRIQTRSYNRRAVRQQI